MDQDTVYQKARIRHMLRRRYDKENIRTYPAINPIEYPNSMAIAH